MRSLAVPDVPPGNLALLVSRAQQGILTILQTGEALLDVVPESWPGQRLLRPARRLLTGLRRRGLLPSRREP